MNRSIYRGWITGLKVLLVILILATFMGYWFVNREENYDNQYLAYAAKLEIYVERYARYMIEFIDTGDEESYRQIISMREEISKVLEILRRGLENKVGEVVLPPSPASIQNNELAKVSDQMAIYLDYSDVIIANRGIIQSLYKHTKASASTLDKLQDHLLKIMNSLANRQDITGNDYETITQQLYTIQNISEAVQAYLDPEINIEKTTKELPRSMNAFEERLKYMQERYKLDILSPTLYDIEKEFLNLKVLTNDLKEIAPVLVTIYNNWYELRKKTPILIDIIRQLELAYDNFSEDRPFNITTVFILSGLAFINLILLMYLLYKEQQYILKQSEKEIQALIDDIKDLSSGNLSIEATVGPGMTAAIAEAINYSLNALRDLVNNINSTSQKVSSSVNEVGKIMQELSRANQYQTGEIVNTGTSISLMASTLDEVSSNAKESMQIAQNSVDIAIDGAHAVHDTISGMDRIREQIQETEKRMHLLGDSSAEIGEIVSIMDDLSERTNILALNAAIQAAMVGEAGMGFAIVADEVQMLAVKSSQAVKQVETVVTAIRSDTNRASRAMEHAIREVYAGTRLAYNAGHALEKVEKVSKHLAEMIQTITTSTDEQAKMANKIAKIMDVIESISRQTASGSSTTVEAIEHLSNLMQSLQNSVAEFKA